jgi:hypothetical protein
MIFINHTILDDAVLHLAVIKAAELSKIKIGKTTAIPKYFDINHLDIPKEHPLIIEFRQSKLSCMEMIDSKYKLGTTKAIFYSDNNRLAGAYVKIMIPRLDIEIPKSYSSLEKLISVIIEITLHEFSHVKDAQQYKTSKNYDKAHRMDENLPWAEKMHEIRAIKRASKLLLKIDPGIAKLLAKKVQPKLKAKRDRLVTNVANGLKNS